MKRLTTGKVAEYCGFKNSKGEADSRKVARMIDNNELPGEIVDSSLGRKRTRVVRLSDLFEFMIANGIPLSGFDGEFDKLNGDACAHRFILKHRKAELRALIEQEGKRGGVFCGFKGLSSALAEVLRSMEPLDNLSGASEDRKRMLILEELTRVMTCHRKLQNRIVRIVSKTKR